MHQINSTDVPTDVVKRDTKNSFFVKEQALCNPDKFTDPDLARVFHQQCSGKMVEDYLDCYKQSPKFHEDVNGLEILAKI